MGILTASDRVAGRLAKALSGFGQVALIAMGVHLAADRLDDLALVGLGAVQAGLDRWLAGPLVGLAEWVHLPYDTLLFWDGLPLAVMAAGLALGVEVLAILSLSASFLFTHRQTRLSWARYRRALSVRAVVLPLCLSGVLLAGSWSLSMAAEDLLPPSRFAPWAAWALGVAASLRFGLAAWVRAVANIERPTHVLRSLLVSAVLAPVGLIAWMEGVPFWGWLP